MNDTKNPPKPRPYVKKLESSIKGAVVAQPGRKTLILGPNGCHRAGQLILMHDGSVRAVEEIGVGDALAGPEGAREVISLCRGTAPMFEIAPIKGDAFVVNGAHVLTLVYCASTPDRGTTEGQLIDVAVNEWVTWPAWRKNLYKLVRSAVGEFAGAATATPLDPYFLGALLGDGSLTRGVEITKPDPEIADLARSEAQRWGLTPVPVIKQGQISGWRISAQRGVSNPILDVLRDLRVWGTTSGERFVPESFRRGSMHTRLGVLAGLLDTAGHLEGTSTFDYISQSKRLADDVVFIARSAGLSAYVKPCEKRDQNGSGGTYYRVSVGGETWIVPTRIKRKRARAWDVPVTGRKGGHKNALRVGFQISPLGDEEPFFGFTLDGDGRYLLGDFTVTHNSGKSAVVNALEAAGSGRVSDVAGRPLLAKDADLSMLSHADRVWSEAHLSDGSKAIWELSKGHRAKRTGPEIAFPLRGVRDAILGSPETARKWVLEQAGEAITWGEIVSLVPESLKKRLESIAGGDSAIAHNPATDLSLALEEARKRVREANAEAKAHRAVTAPPGPPASDEEVAKYEAIIKGWEARGAAPAIDATREALVAARENAEALAKLIAHSEGELAKIGDLTPTTVLRTAAVTVVEAMAAKRTPSCWICGGKCDPSTIATRAVVGRVQITADASAAKRRLDLEFTLREANADLVAARREVERLAAEEARIERLAKSSTVQATPLPIPLEDARNLLRGAYDRRAGWAAARRAEEKALEAEREGVEWSQLADALGKALGILVEKARAAFEARVQKYLPEGDLFGIDLLDDDREIMRVGLRRSDRAGISHLDAPLSGAEWARVTAALALATAPSEGPCVVIPEERAFDSVMLARVLEVWDRALVDASAPQVVIASPIEPAKIPSGWTVIRVGELPKVVKEKEPESLLEKIGVVGPPLEKIADVASPEDLEARDAREREALNLPKRRGRPPGKKNAAREERAEAQASGVPDIPLPPAPLEFFPVKDDAGNQVGLKSKKEETPKEKSPSDLFDPFA